MQDSNQGVQTQKGDTSRGRERPQDKSWHVQIRPWLDLHFYIYVYPNWIKLISWPSSFIIFLPSWATRLQVWQHQKSAAQNASGFWWFLIISMPQVSSFPRFSSSFVGSWFRNRQDHVQDGAAFQSSFKEHVQKRSFEAQNWAKRRNWGTDVAQNANGRWKSETLRYRFCMFLLHRCSSLFKASFRRQRHFSCSCWATCTLAVATSASATHTTRAAGDKAGDAQQIEKMQAWFMLYQAIYLYIGINSTHKCKHILNAYIYIWWWYVSMYIYIYIYTFIYWYTLVICTQKSVRVRSHMQHCRRSFACQVWHSNVSISGS